MRGRVAEMFADTQFNYGVWQLARAMSARMPQTWRYLFLRRRPGRLDGPNHGEEVPYIFNTLGFALPGQETAPFDGIDEDVAEAMQAAWVRFAATGDPNGGALPHWPAYRAEDDDAIGSGMNWRCRQMDFLDSYYARMKEA